MKRRGWCAPRSCRFALTIVKVDARAVMLAAMVGTVDAAAQLPCSYEVSVLPNVSCFDGSGTPVAINNLGHVLLMVSQCAEPQYHDTRLWTGGATTILIPPPAGYLGFIPSDLNDYGLIVGYAEQSTGGWHGAMYDMNTGVWTIIPPLNPPLGWSGIASVNNAGEICGFQSNGTMNDPLNPYQAFRKSPGSAIEHFGNPDGRNTEGIDINADGIVTVSSGLAIVGAFGYIWTRSDATNVLPPNCISSDAGFINDSGFIAVDGIVTADPLQFAVYSLQRGEFQLLNPLPTATSVSIYDISNSGLISGRSNFGLTTKKACVWTEGHAIDLLSLVPSSFNGSFREARMSPNGHLAVTGQSPPGSNKVFMLRPVYGASGDTNCDARIDVADLLGVITAWGSCAGCRSDLDGNGIVNVSDLYEVIIHWGS